MKKLFAIFAAALIASSAMALDGVNIMASGLKATVSEDNMVIEYVLNTDATELEVEFFDETGDLVSLVTIEDAEDLTAGAHQTTIAIPYEDLEPGQVTWGIHAYGQATEFANVLPVGDPRYSFYLPQDVVVDNSFESEYFGRIYVSMPWEGESDGGSDVTKVQKRGLFYYDPSMETVNGVDSALVGFDGGLGGDIHSRAGIKRMSVDEQGNVYVASRDAETKGVYRANPSDLSLPFETVLASEYAVDAVEVVGSKLYTIEDVGGETGGQINTYSLNNIPVAAPSKTWSAGELSLANADVTIRSDRHEGFWIVQHRYAADAYAALSHLKKNGERDFVIDANNNADLLSNNEGGLTYRGTMGVNLEGNLIALGSNKKVVVFAVEWDEDGVPSLTKLCETANIGSNIDGIAFDAADNIYVASASAEQFRMYPIAKENNNSRVMAAARYGFEVPEPIEIFEHLYEIGDNQSWNPAQGIEMTMTDVNIFEGTFTFTAATSYFAFVTLQSSDWDLVNANRFGGATNNQLVADGDVAELVKSDGCLTIAPGVYTFVVDLNEYTVTVSEEESAVDNVNADTKPVKVIRDAQILIQRNGVEYNVLGAEVK